MARIDSIRAQVGVPAGGGAFQAALDTQMSTGSVDVLEVGVARPVSVTNVEGTGIATSAEFETYLRDRRIEERNGRLDGADLQPISGGLADREAALVPPAARAFEEMRSAAARDGIDLRVVDAYRTWESQAAAYEDYLAGRKKEHVVAPGTSKHGNGAAIDVSNGAIVGTDDPEWQWLQGNAQRFGWHPISNETWHWEFRGV